MFGLSESQIARRVKAVARAAGLPDWEFFSGHSGRVGMAQNGAPNHEIERQGRWKQGGGMVGRHPRRINRFGSAVLVGNAPSHILACRHPRRVGANPLVSFHQVEGEAVDSRFFERRIRCAERDTVVGLRRRATAVIVMPSEAALFRLGTLCWR